MAKTDDWLAGFKTPLMVWAMALVTGGAVLLPRTGSAPGPNGPAASEPRSTSVGAARDPAAADLSDVRPVITLLAEATGTALDPNSASRAAAALRRLWASAPKHAPDGKESQPAQPQNTASKATSEFDPALVAAIDTLFRPRETEPGAQIAAEDRHKRIEALRTLRTHLVPDDSRAAEVKRQLTRLLAAIDPSDDLANLDAITMTATRARTEVRFVTATLPDYVDSQVRRLFDLAASGIQQAAAALGYTLDRFYLPNAPGARTGDPTLHEDQPGAIVFRRPKGQQTELLVVLIVTETPTAGLHQRPFLAATMLESEWGASVCRAQRETPCSPAPALNVLGPTFSGTSHSLHLALERVAERSRRPSSIRIVTGSATAPKNRETLEVPLPNGLALTFHSTVQTSTAILNAIGNYLGGIRKEWGRGEGVALLVESNTVFGQSVSVQQAPESSVEATGGREGRQLPTLQDAVQVRFPLHISRLRSVVLAPVVARVGAPRVRITLEEGTPSTDLVPAATPELTSSVVDAALRSLFSALRRERISAIGVLATDARDHLFLAREIRREMPDAQMFGTQADLLYLNPDYAPFLRGTLIASPYPLFGQTQLQTPRAIPNLRRQFGLSGEQGIYNALIALVAGVKSCERDKRLACVEPSPVLDFGPPGANCRNQACAPPVWISAIGRNEIWPMATFQGEPGPEVLRVSTDSLEEGHPGSFATWWAGAILLFVSLVTWFHAGGLLIADFQRLRGRAESPGKARTSGNTGRLEKMSTRLGKACDRKLSWRFETWRALHYLPSQVAREAPGIDSHLAVPRTQAERCADQAYDVALLMLLLSLVLANLWTHWWAWIFVLDNWGWKGAPFSVVTSTALTTVLLLTALTRVGLRLIRRTSEPGAPPSAPRAWLRPHAPWLRNGGVWGVVAAALLVLLLALSFSSLTWTPSRGLAFTRAAALTSGVSPTLPILLLTSVLYLTATWNLRRLKMHRYSVANGWWIGKLLSGGNKPFEKQLRRAAIEFAPWQSTGTPLGIALPLMVVIVVVSAGFRQGYTVEGLDFSRWFWWATVVALIAMARVAARAASQGEFLLRALKRLESHPIVEAYTRLSGRPFDWTLSLKPLRRSSLAPVIDEVKLLVAGSNDLAHTPDRDRILAAAEQLIANADPWRDDRVPVMATREWRHLLDLGSVLTQMLTRHYWATHLRLHRARQTTHRGATSAGTTSSSQRQDGSTDSTERPLTAFERAELIVGYMLTFVIRNLLARVVSSLWTALLGFSLVLAAHLTYSFAGRDFWVRIDVACLTATAIVACFTLVRFERDRVLSLLWSTDPGRINWTGGFIYRIAATVAIPFLLLAASFFPELGESLTSVLDPLQKTLP